MSCFPDTLGWASTWGMNDDHFLDLTKLWVKGFHHCPSSAVPVFGQVTYFGSLDFMADQEDSLLALRCWILPKFCTDGGIFSLKNFFGTWVILFLLWEEQIFAETSYLQQILMYDCVWELCNHPNPNQTQAGWGLPKKVKSAAEIKESPSVVP